MEGPQVATAEVHGAESDHRDEGPNASMDGRPLRQTSSHRLLSSY